MLEVHEHRLEQKHTVDTLDEQWTYLDRLRWTIEVIEYVHDSSISDPGR